MNILQKQISEETGLTIIECVIALVITMIGVLSAAGLIAVGIRLQVESRDASTASSFAQAKIEQLRNSSATSAERARGGSLTTDVNGYFDLPNTRFRRRWRIETNPLDLDVPADTQRITVSITSDIEGVIPVVDLVTLVPSS